MNDMDLVKLFNVDSWIQDFEAELLIESQPQNTRDTHMFFWDGPKLFYEKTLSDRMILIFLLCIIYFHQCLGGSGEPSLWDGAHQLPQQV